MSKTRVLKIDENTGFGQKLLTCFVTLTVLTTTAANIAFTFAPETMTRLVQSLLI